MTTTETKITPEQLAALQQVWPQGGECTGPTGERRPPRKGEWFYVESNNLLNGCVRQAECDFGTDDTRRIAVRIVIPPLDPLKLKVDAWIGEHRMSGMFIAVDDKLCADDAASAIIQSWEKFKEAGE